LMIDSSSFFYFKNSFHSDIFKISGQKIKPVKFHQI
jgi:hypothetical protein